VAKQQTAGLSAEQRAQIVLAKKAGLTTKDLPLWKEAMAKIKGSSPFLSFIDVVNLIFLCWNVRGLNVKASSTLCRLDRVLGSVEWHTIFPCCFLQSLPSSLSDHCALLSTMFDVVKCKRFKFESHWLEKEGFMEMVQEAWNSYVAPRLLYVHNCLFNGWNIATSL
jgi:hypothetical protein